ncbi:MAG: hypothetical protein HRT87_02535 [Legionellales bacterium]|nr:hypothetical protein [Legionellales bacterium]
MRKLLQGTIMLRKILIFFTGISGILLSNNTFAASAKTKVIIAEQSVITGIKATARITITATDLQQALANNTPIETDVIASACMFTTHKDGDYDLTITAEREYLQGKDFALYNASLGKIKSSLLLNSVLAPEKIEIDAGKATPLKDHSCKAPIFRTVHNWNFIA